jgi:tetratricopeptide (TPR) repeat protein
MKNFILIAFGLLCFAQSPAQMPLPCTQLTNGVVPSVQSIQGDYYRNCIRIENTQVNWDGQSRKLHGEEIVVDQDFHVEATAGSGGDFVLEAQNRGSLEGTWFFPANTYQVPIYEKVEWGLKLPPEVMDAINHFIINDSTGSALMPSVNPFDDEQIDVVAEIRKLENGLAAGPVQPVYGFFYREYEKIWRDHNPDNLPDMDDPDNWRRREIISDYKFRIRWSPAAVGLYQVEIKVNVPGIGQYSLLPFQFEATWNDPKKSFISVTPNGKYFQTADGEVFFPVGQNLWRVSCRCDKLLSINGVNENHPDCDSCYADGADNLCCGLDEFLPNYPYDWRGSMYRGVDPDMQRNTEHIAVYLKMMERLDPYKQAGANMLRMSLYPILYEFEFEKLNNYYDRLFMADELDKFFDKAKSLDLRIDFCIQNQDFYLQHGGGATHWDYTNLLTRYGELQPNEVGYCYFTQSDLTNCTLEPVSFCTEAEAKKYYKKKLRYFIARYGYSSTLMSMELWSEANNVGNRAFEKIPTENEVAFADSLLGPIDHSYKWDITTRYAMGQWQIEMAEYIKNGLKHSSHPLGTHYAGFAMTELQANTSPYYDDSWKSPIFDYKGYSSYDRAIDRYRKMTDAPDNETDWDRIREASLTNQRPVLHLESGPTDYFNDIDVSAYEKELWCNGFAGFASSAMAWGWQTPTPVWNMMAKVDQFFKEHVFSMEGFTDTNHWVSDYADSNEGGNHAKWSEAVYLRNTETHTVVGILMNRTWNTYTTTTANLEIPYFWNQENLTMLNELYVKYLGVQLDEGKKFTTFVNLTYDSDDAPQLKSMGFCNSYVIVYYDPYTLQIISISQDDGDIMGKLKLKHFPTLSAVRPYVLFKIVKTGICGQNSPMLDLDSMEHHSERNEQLNGNKVTSLAEDNSTPTDQCQLMPNPFESNLNIQCNFKMLNLQVFDSNGNIIFTIDKPNSQNDFSFLSPGVYTLKILGASEVKTFKIVKL